MTPAGLARIMTQMPRKAESFSSLSRMFLSDVHLEPEMLLALARQLPEVEVV